MLIAIAVWGHAANAQSSVKLAWNPNPEQDVTGYLILVGTASGDYTSSVDAGNTTVHEVSGLAPATTYYFALQAYNSAGYTSDFSNEIQFATLPGGPY